MSTEKHSVKTPTVLCGYCFKPLTKYQRVNRWNRFDIDDCQQCWRCHKIMAADFEKRDSVAYSAWKDLSQEKSDAMYRLEKKECELRWKIQRITNLRRRRVRHKERCEIDVRVAITADLRRQFSSAVRRHLRGQGKPKFPLLGCPLDVFVRYIEAQFTGDMSWANYGRPPGVNYFKTWELDHIIPVSRFDLTDHIQQALCFHYTNFRPLNSSRNSERGNRCYSPNLSNLVKFRTS
jgi:hypothetical protein